jgi:hypothetical protein|tara:strand:- start:1153 stop:1701 length:549 start_codon:yes stop_codon:yes gene_type:complete
MDLKNKKYLIFKNFLSEEVRKLLENHCKITHRNNKDQFSSSDDVTEGDSYFYADPIMEALLVTKGPEIEKKLGVELLPTYSFWRMYTKYSRLVKHSDRPSCEYSVSVFIGGDQTHKWPFIADGNKINIDPGDAIFYKGCEIKHWREEFLGDYQAQLFLHYVDKNGPNANCVLDGRLMLGQKN